MNPHRSILAWLLALLIGVTLSAGGCASGGSDTGGGGDDGASGDDVAISDGAYDAGCAAGKTKCGTTCTSTSTDPKNCGRCGLACATGEVCSKGTCGFSCSPPETLCGGPSEAGTGSGGDSGAGDDGGDGSADDATLESGTVDATVPGDGGTVAPYCSNLNTDPANCGTCGNNCGANASCSGGTCAISCPTGKKVCFANNSCIPSNSCCQSGDCTLTGQVCPMPGGMCGCPTGEKECAGTLNSCISTMACCTNADCTVAGQTCATPGQPCKCNASLQCCVAADCPTEPNVMTYTCGPPQPANKCGVGSCKAGCYDLDNMFADGCECCDDTYGHACSAATDGGALMLGQMLSYTGEIPTPTGTDWFTVTFNNESNTTFHGKIDLVQTGTEFVFDVVQGSCTGGAMSCGTEGGTCTGKTTWEDSYAGPSPAGDPNSHAPGGASNFTPISPIGKVFIKVYRANMASPATCTQFSLNITE